MSVWRRTCRPCNRLLLICVVRTADGRQTMQPLLRRTWFTPLSTRVKLKQLIQRKRVLLHRFQERVRVSSLQKRVRMRRLQQRARMRRLQQRFLLLQIDPKVGDYCSVFHQRRRLQVRHRASGASHPQLLRSRVPVWRLKLLGKPSGSVRLDFPNRSSVAPFAEGQS